MLTGAEVIADIRQQTDTILVAFSRGKDSIAAWLECRKHFPRIVPYFMYGVPGLEFVEDSLQYFERFFGQRIIRVPHPSLYRKLNALVFQPPERCRAIADMDLPNFDYFDMQNEIRRDLKLGDECYTASGVRSADSPIRLLSIKKHGAINHTKRQFFPIWDWRKDRLVKEITSAGCELPIDYEMFGRSFDGIDYRFLEPISRYFPRDYQRILEWFPLADLEIERRRYVGH